MDINTLKNLTNEIKSSQQILDNSKKALAESLSELMEDETIDLFDRWCIFLEYSYKAYGVDQWVINEGPALDLVQKERYMERYQTYLYCDVFDEYYVTEERRNQYPDAVLACQERFKELDEEGVLEIIYSGSAGFINDW